MGLSDELIALARLCSDHVFLPEGVGCCGFAGDKGFTHPEMNRYALHKLRPQIEANCIEVGYSNSRTCEVGLQANTGIPYMNIAYLVNECTTAARPLYASSHRREEEEGEEDTPRTAPHSARPPSSPPLCLRLRV